MPKEQPDDAKKITSDQAPTTAAEQTVKPEAITDEAASTPAAAHQQDGRPADEVEKLRHQASSYW